MRITCTPTALGNVFRFYRNSDNFHAELKPLVPFLLQSDADLVVGDVDGEPGVLLLVGPLRPEAEAELLRRVRRHIAPDERP